MVEFLSRIVKATAIPDNMIYVSNKRKRHNFTLIELLIVFSIILMMGAVLSINVVQAIKQQRFLSGSREILDRLQMAQDLMLMQKTTIIVTLTQEQVPTPHIVCLLEAHIPNERKEIKKILDNTKMITGIQKLEFIDTEGVLHQGKATFHFIQPGNHNKGGVLYLYADALKDTQPQTIVVEKHPRPLKLLAGLPASINNTENTSLSAVLFPTEIYEIKK